MHPSTRAETHLWSCDGDTRLYWVGSVQRSPCRLRAQSRCGVGPAAVARFGKEKRGAGGGDTFPAAPESCSRGRTPGPPTGKSPRLQAVRRGGRQTAGMSPQKPPGFISRGLPPGRNSQGCSRPGEGSGRRTWPQTANLPTAVKDPPVPCPGGRRGLNPHRGSPDSPLPLPAEKQREPADWRGPPAPPVVRAGPLASFPGPPPPAPPPLGIFGTFLSCSNFPAPSPAKPNSGSRSPPDLTRHTRTGGWRRRAPKILGSRTWPEPLDRAGPSPETWRVATTQVWMALLNMMISN